MKIETKHWMAASKMMIAAGKAMSPEAITLDVSALVEGKGKEKEKEKEKGSERKKAKETETDKAKEKVKE